MTRAERLASGRMANRIKLYRTAWEACGQWEEAKKGHIRGIMEGLRSHEAWGKVMEEMPPTVESLVEARRALGEKRRREVNANWRRRKEKMGKGKPAAGNLVEALAWVFENLGVPRRDVGDPPVKGAYELLEAARKDVDGFYEKWLPVLVKGKGEQAAPLEPQLERGEQEVDKILARLKGNGQ